MSSNQSETDSNVLRRIALGGGCHWCTEGVFISLRGVEKVEQGWVTSEPPADAWSEAVIVHYDPTVVTIATLIAVHLATHAATKAHALRHRYRSAIYYFNPADRAPLEQELARAAASFDEPVLTAVLPFVAFKPSLPEHQDYFRSDPEKPFCQRFIWPKLRGLETELLKGELFD
ncbi:peptide-methionine (S)-S-oxide reductase [Lewinella sp. 4G2]|uniref:peptide-methionine (S)-S-oxide reductase n=1 Tax=Lewinella sp. 4G2 TaxID=1803372 RepID=UPI0007B4CCC6|nr:peptide-methionine (S)-S-oxide reductase [Lewinella sp. 4G2]OAV44105.1 peptide methionine sulfoxide reductase [Lewinella sp. 4G2]